MVKYTCFRCGYTNKVKTIFINHLNRKYTCQPLLNDIPIEEIYIKLEIQWVKLEKIHLNQKQNLIQVFQINLQ